MFDKSMNEQMNQRYQKKETTEPVMGQMGEDPMMNPQEEMREYNNPIHHEDEEIAPGLFQSDIQSWKQQFGDIYLVDIKGNPFVFRTMTRFEYKEIISTPNTDPLMREEMMAEYCVLYPQGYNFSQMMNENAGLPAVLSEMIMEQSGFTRDVKIQRL